MADATANATTKARDFTDTLVLVTSDGMGQADPALRVLVLEKYLGVLDANGTLPGAMAFYTNGVKLVVEGSPVLARLQDLERKGVRMVVCKTCLDWFKLADKVKVGVVGGMGDIVAAQVMAKKVVTI